MDADQNIQGSLVYYKQRRLGLRQIKMPPMTSYSGLWINYPKNIKKHNAYALDKSVINALVEQLPTFDLFYQQLHPDIKNGLPFQWLGFSTTYVYTYQLKLDAPELIYQNVKGSIRTDLKKARQKLHVVEDKKIDPFLELLQTSYRNKGQQLPYDLDKLVAIDQLLSNWGKRTIFLAKDKFDTIHAGVYIIWDNDKAYYYIGVRNTGLDKYNALTFALWNAIKESSTHCNFFDFEGSIIPDIEFYFRAFGGTLTPHIKLSKTRNKLFHILSLIMNTEYH
jgi:hypothetical protein